MESFPRTLSSGRRGFLLVLAMLTAQLAGPSMSSADPGKIPPTESTKKAAQSSGWRVDISGGGTYSPSHGAEVVLLPATGFAIGGGAEFVMENWIPIRTELSIYSIGASAWDSTLFRYRAFWGYRLVALTGMRFGLGSGELDFLLGGALSASKYTGLSAVTSYASIAGEFRWLVPLAFPFLQGRALSAFASVPIEYMFRGSARTISLGLDLGISLKLQKGASK